MKFLVLSEYPPSPSGLSTQADILYRAMRENGEQVMVCNLTASLQKQWIYELFQPDVAIGVGNWTDTPNLLQHPRRFGVRPVPWYVADGWVANYQEEIGSLPLVFVTSEWVKKTYARDGVDTKNFIVAHVGIEPELFKPISRSNPQVKLVRRMLGVAEDELMILTVGGDVTTKGAQEVLKALKIVNRNFRKWKYICKIWGEGGTASDHRNTELQLIEQLGVDKFRVRYEGGIYSREFFPYLLNACDIYAAPSRLEGYGMIQMEAQSCGIPVVSIDAMGPKEIILHGQTGFLARVAERIELTEEWAYEDMGFETKHKKKFHTPKIFAYRADTEELVEYLLRLLTDSVFRKTMGRAAREHAVANFEYHKLAGQMVQIIRERLDLP